MNHADYEGLEGWLIEAGLSGTPETEILAGLCERLTGLGMPVGRAMVIVDTLHPVYEGRLFRWRSSRRATESTEYGRSDADEQTAARWRESVFYHLLETGRSHLRQRLTGTADHEFPHYPELRADGMTDYLAIVKPFTASGAIGELDCVYQSWATDHPEGFRDADIDALVRLTPTLSLAVKSVSLARVAETLVETYLGRDAGRRVLSGRISRGVADRIDAVLWFSDLQGYTRITEAIEPEAIIPLLNAYSEAVIAAINAAGGDVLKLMGDGILAIFPAGDRPDERSAACRAALAAAEDAWQRIDAVNAERAADGLPVTGMYLGLHIGEMFYGNIGSAERLDFTVVGPAVNEVSRIAAMCRSVDQPVLVSSAFREAAGVAAAARLVSVGRYALRGVGAPQHLFTLDRGS